MDDGSDWVAIADSTIQGLDVNGRNRLAASISIDRNRLGGPAKALIYISLPKIHQTRGDRYSFLAAKSP